MDDFADLNRRLESLIRLGTIAKVDHAKARVRVQSGKLTTEWLPWLTARAGTTKEWDPPTEGEQCLLISTSGETTTGFVLLGLFSDANPAPSSSPDEHVRQYPDGARISYNHATGALSITGIKTALVQADEHVTVDCPESTFTGNVTIKGKLTVIGDALFKATATVTKLFSYLSGMSGKNGDAGGETTIEGTIRHTKGELSSNGVVLDGHDHGEVERGNDRTGGPR